MTTDAPGVVPAPGAGVGALPVYTRSDALPVPFEAGALLVDKPPRLTSFGVVRRVRRALGVKKVGHAGTLDPMATGLLVVLIGRAATREQERFMGLEKEYVGTLRLGETTPSFDADTPVGTRAAADGVTDAALAEAVGRFVGEIRQRPPAFSAIKVGGERLYKKARRGEDVAVEPRAVAVYEFRLRARRGPDVDFLVRCSKGTYIRSLAHDLGQTLGVGAHLVALRRTAIGPYRVEDALGLEDLAPRSTESPG